MTPHEERWILTQVGHRPWREALAAVLAEDRPELYARLTDPGQAAILPLLGIADGAQCLDATTGWGQLALPLAGRARVVVLAPSATRAVILRQIAAQEGVALHVVAGGDAANSFRPESFDAVLLHDRPAATAESLRQAVRLLRPGGILYLGAANELWRAMQGADRPAPAEAVTRTLAFYEGIFRETHLTVAASYACFPDHTQPRYLVPLTLVDAFVATHADAAPQVSGGIIAAYSGLAAERITRHFAPSFAFVLRK